MKNIGVLLVLAGVALCCYALLMDVSVPVGIGTRRVNNLGLMADRQNYILISAVLFIGGILLIRKRSVKSDVTVKQYDMTSLQNDNFTNEDGEINNAEVDSFAKFLLKKHKKSSVADIMLMNSPVIDKITNNMHGDNVKNFRKQLEKNLKEHSQEY